MVGKKLKEFVWKGETMLGFASRSGPAGCSWCLLFFNYFLPQEGTVEDLLLSECSWCKSVKLQPQLLPGTELALLSNTL